MAAARARGIAPEQCDLALKIRTSGFICSCIIVFKDMSGKGKKTDAAASAAAAPAPAAKGAVPVSNSLFC